MKILIVDDEPIFLEYMKTTIEQHLKAIVMTAENGRQALKLLKEHSFSIAFLDIILRGMTGLEIAEFIKKENKKTEIIMVSAFQDFEYTQHSIRLQVDDYLLKPLIESELISILRKYEDAESNLFSSGHPYIDEAIKIINESFLQEVKLSDLANKLNLTPQYLSHLFKEQTGQNISVYILKKRITYSKKLLSESDKSIQWISEESGFNSQHYFNRVFKRIEGITPNLYRELKLKRGGL